MSAPTATPARTAADRAAQRLDAWARQHPQAAALARLASLAVRVDASLLRRLRLQLLPRAEPGIEADLWFAGLHAAQGGGSLVFDAAVQQLLRTQLCQASAAPGQPRPLQAAWDITRGLHAAWPEALRTEETITFLALQGGDGAAAAIAQALQPALAAMATGGDARALEIARWAQRAMPRLPDAARQHPAALALWLGALVRLGATSGPLPAPGADGLPPDLRWLLPAGTGTTPLRVACQPLADGLRLQPLADGAADAAQQITLPAAGAQLLAVVSQDAAGQAQHQTVLLQGDTTVPLPADWQQVTLHNLAGQRWQLRRQAGGAAADGAPLAWAQMRVQVLGTGGARGQGLFVSDTEVVTLVDTLPAALFDPLHRALGQGADLDATVHLVAQDAQGRPVPLQARLVVRDLRTPLALLALSTPVAGAVWPQLSPIPELPRSPVWIGAWPGAGAERWDGVVRWTAGSAPQPPGQPKQATLAQALHIDLTPSRALSDAATVIGAPVFTGRLLAGIVHLDQAGPADPGTSTVMAIAAPDITRFLAWARRPDALAPQVLLHHAADPTSRTTADADAVQRIVAAARRAKLRLVMPAEGNGPSAGAGRPGEGVATPGLAAAVRLVTPTTSESATPEARLRLLSLAAQRWARPDFGVLHLALRLRQERTPLPPPLAGMALHEITQFDPEDLARMLLDTTEPADELLRPAGSLRQVSQGVLEQQLIRLARPFMPADKDLHDVVAAARGPGLTAVAELVSRRWNSSSRLDAVPLAEVLAALALPIADDGLLEPLRDATPGAVAWNAMPAQLARLAVQRAHAGRAARTCVVVRDQSWAGEHSALAIHGQVAAALAAGLDCTPDDAAVLLDRLDLAPWVLVTTRPLPDAETLLALQTRLPSARWFFLAGPQSDLADAARASRIHLLPPLREGQDMAWLAGYKQLMEWARPRRRASPRPHPPRRTPVRK
jgi:hypothetical protein